LCDDRRVRPEDDVPGASRPTANVNAVWYHPRAKPDPAPAQSRDPPQPEKRRPPMTAFPSTLFAGKKGEVRMGVALHRAPRLGRSSVWLSEDFTTENTEGHRGPRRFFEPRRRASVAMAKAVARPSTRSSCQGLTLASRDTGPVLSGRARVLCSPILGPGPRMTCRVRYDRRPTLTPVGIIPVRNPTQTSSRATNLPILRNGARP